ncbi:hypothetical protein Q5P01_014589 [Channa striata]|uniref:Uncharacterized protein n=1 Tax=Channa striata TaxID=64152 RepID=A0AA88MIS7_CHASR|nr:hypothetical protein Q5P01_014589 [Channa striata]
MLPPFATGLTAVFICREGNEATQAVYTGNQYAEKLWKMKEVGGKKWLTPAFPGPWSRVLQQTPQRLPRWGGETPTNGGSGVQCVYLVSKAFARVLADFMGLCWFCSKPNSRCDVSQ